MASHTLRCTFCKKTEHEVQKLVAGPGVYICDACIALAHRIVSEADPPAPSPRPDFATRLHRVGRALRELLVPRRAVERASV